MLFRSSDGANVSTCSFTVTVVDNTPPVALDCPSNINLTTNGRQTCDQAATWVIPTAVDNCSGVVSVSSNYNPGNLFPVGTTTVTYTFNDGANVSTCNFTVTVVDDTPPVIVCPAEIVACQIDNLSLGTATATDNCGIKSIYSNAPDAYQPGTTVVTWTAIDIHGNSSTCDQTIIINEPALVNAGPDASVCPGTQYTISSASASNYSSILWTHNGSGTLVNANTLTPGYISGPNEAGIVQLAFTATGNVPCGSVTDTMNLEIFPGPHADAGPDIDACHQNSIKITGASATNYASISWTHNGLGTLENGNTLTPIYLPATGENGSVTLTMSLMGSGSCGESADVMVININPLASVSIGADLSTCGTSPVVLSQISASNYGSIEWTTSGSGTFSDRFIINPVYYPSASDLTDRHIKLTLTAYGVGVCASMTISDSLTLTLKQSPVVDAGTDQVISANSDAFLSGSAAGGSTAYSYSWQPADMVLSPESNTTRTVALTETTTFMLSVVDLISGCADKDSVVVTVNEGPIHLPPTAVDDYDTTLINNPVLINPLTNDSDPYGSPLTYIITQGPSHGTFEIKDNLVFYTPEKDYTGDDKISYVISDKDKSPKSDNATIYIHIGQGLPLIIHNVITPNGDGLNDKWIIEGIEEYPENEAMIFNRWGDKIKTFHRYDNAGEAWDGTNEHNARVPDGTYFYILNIKNAGEFKGWIFVRGNS